MTLAVFSFYYFPVLEEVKMKQKAPDMQMDEVEKTSDALDDIDRRLLDLENNAKDSQTSSARALNLIDDLSVNTMPDIDMNIDDITFTADLIDQDIAMSNDQLNASAENMNIANDEMLVNIHAHTLHFHNTCWNEFSKLVFQICFLTQDKFISAEKNKKTPQKTDCSIDFKFYTRQVCHEVLTSSATFDLY